MVRPGTVCAKSAVEWTPASSREAEVTEEIATGTFCAFSARLFALTTISSRCPSDADSGVATDCAKASDAKPSAPMHNISSTNLLVIFLSPTIGCMATMNRRIVFLPLHNYALRLPDQTHVVRCSAWESSNVL